VTPPLTPIDVAYSLLREGRLVEAEELMVRELRTVTDKHGRGSLAWASAQCDLGSVLLNADQLDRAIECFRSAVAVPAGGDMQARKDYLTYRTNLGAALQMAGRLDEAEAEFRQGAQERADFYGREHAGYAFGLEPLADVLLQRGNVRQARQVIEEAVANFGRNGHERIATALALRAEIVKADGTDEAPFPEMDPLPDRIVEQVGYAVLNRSGRCEPTRYKAILTNLIAILEARRGPDHQATLNALSMVANMGRDYGDQSGRIEAIQRVLASYDRQGRAEDAVMATQGLAMSHSEAGDEQEALRTRASAYSRAERIGCPELSSQVLRNWGLVLKEAGQAGPAEQRLSEAVTQARRGADHETLGRADIALGIFLHHEGRLTDARAALEGGLSFLDVAHPDAIVGRSHLSAVIDRRTCGCGDLTTTMAEAFRSFVTARLPADLLSDVDVAIADGDFQIQVGLRRQPTPDEIERLNGVIQSAQAEFRRRINTG
jgi:tetratricopeptide (TPR) repeat protein